MENFILSKEQQVMLRLEHKLAKKHSAKFAYRINAVLLLGTGWTLSEVSNALLLDIETLRSYINTFQAGGIKKLLENNYNGKQFYLTPAQQISLTRHLESNLYRTTSDVILYVKQAFKLSYSRSGLTKLLHSLGFSYKKPKLLPSGINFEAQREFLEYFHSFMERKNDADAVVFYDSSHPQFQSHADYGWIKRGKDILLPNHGMRGHVNISGCIDIDSGDVIVDFPEKVNANSTVKIFKKIESNYSAARSIHIVLDNAAMHKAVIVKDFLNRSKINLVFLPPYSPNLNIMERVWGLLRRKLLGNSFNETYFDFKDGIKNFFRKTLKRKKEEWLLPLITEDFESFSGPLLV